MPESAIQPYREHDRLPLLLRPRQQRSLQVAAILRSARKMHCSSSLLPPLLPLHAREAAQRLSPRPLSPLPQIPEIRLALILLRSMGRRRLPARILQHISSSTALRPSGHALLSCCYAISSEHCPEGAICKLFCNTLIGVNSMQLPTADQCS